MRLSVVYVNFNTQQLLIESLQSLKANLKLKADEYEVIVVDNSSNEFEQSSIHKAFPTARIIELDNNLGFGGGNNEGVRRTKGEYVWLLNTDTLVPKDNNIVKALSYLDVHHEYAALLPLLTDDQGTVQPAQVDSLPSLKELVLLKPFNTLKSALRLRNDDDAEAREYATHPGDVEVAVAAALIVRRSVYLEIGGFDLRYFMYYEDTDLCKKIKERGEKVRFYPDAHIIHLWGGSLGSSSTRKRYYYSSQLKYFRKWHGIVSMLVLAIARLPLVIKNVYLVK